MNSHYLSLVDINHKLFTYVYPAEQLQQNTDYTSRIYQVTSKLLTIVGPNTTIVKFTEVIIHSMP